MRSSKAIAATAATAAILFAHGAMAQTKLTYSNWLPAVHPIHTEVFGPLMEEIAKVTDGRVVVEILPKPVGKVPTQFDTAAQGLADIAFIIDGYSPGRFDANSIGELPFLGNKAEYVGVAYQRIYDRYLSKTNEFKGTVPLGVFVHGPGVIYTSDDVVTSVDGLKGKKIRVPSANAIATVEALGGVPVQKPVTQVYELLSQGVVDGTLMNQEAAKSFNIIPALKNLTIIPGGLYNTTMALVINEERWNSLSEADRKAIMSIAGEKLSRRMGQVQDQADTDARMAMQEAGTKIVTASPELTEALREKVTPVEALWAEKAKAAGLDNPMQVLEEFRAEIKKVEAGS